MYDIVLLGGRVIDPETYLDAERDVAILNGKICLVEPVGSMKLVGKEVIDCRGKVVCAGFIDTHSHGAGHLRSARFAALDGVTTHLELEFGHFPVQSWYEKIEKSGDALIHYGASASHIMARIAAMEKKGRTNLWTQWSNEQPSCHPHLLLGCQCCVAVSHVVCAECGQVEKIVANLEASLDAGSLGVGMGIEYTSEADHEEVYRVFEMVGRRQSCLFIHNRGVRNDIGDFHELFANAAATGASLQICHITASASSLNLPLVLEMIDKLMVRGAADITFEQYPYCAGMTKIESKVFRPGFLERLRIKYTDILWVETDERIKDKEDFDKKQKQGGLVAVFSQPEKLVDMTLSHPRCIVASDAIPFDEEFRSHPRAAGCFCRILRVYVREKGLLTLPQAIAKMTNLPAKRMESCSSAFKMKGRLQKGCDADICVFDPDTVGDTATFSNPSGSSVGVSLVCVDGQIVVRDAKLIEGVAPGKPIRGEKLLKRKLSAAD